MAKVPKAVKKEKREKLSIEAEYAARCAAGPAVLLAAAGPDGAKLSRYAFDASHQPMGPYVVSDVQSLGQLVSDHMAVLAETAEAKPKAFPSPARDGQLVHLALKVAEGIHSHVGRYVHPDCKTRFVVAPNDTRSVYLTSDSTGPARWLSAVMNHFPSGMAPAKLFISQFVFEGEVTTISQLLSRNSKAVREAFKPSMVNDAVVDTLVGIFAEVFSNQDVVIDDCLPQLLWPVANSYLALTAVPALAVVNSIAAMRTLAPENAFVRQGAYAIGSGQPQNQSMAAVGTRGNIPLLECEPPRVFRDYVTDLARQAHASQLMTLVSRKALQAFDKDVQGIPNGNRAIFFNKAARWHTAEAMSKLVDIREAVATGALAVDRLPQGSGALEAFARGEAVTDAMAEELARAVAESGPASLFARHQSSDLVRYSEAVVAEIKSLGA